AFPLLPAGLNDRPGIYPDPLLNVVHRDRDHLALLGPIGSDASAWPHTSPQAELVAAALDVRHPDPEQAAVLGRLEHTDADLEGGLHHVDGPRHSYYQRNATYLALARELLRQLRGGVVTSEPLEVGTVATARRVARRVAKHLPLATGSRRPLTTRLGASVASAPCHVC